MNAPRRWSSRVSGLGALGVHEKPSEPNADGCFLRMISARRSRKPPRPMHRIGSRAFGSLHYMPQSTSQSRSQSQHESAYRRKRSSTLQSMLRSPVSASPLEVGNFKDLTLWVHAVSPSNPVEDVTFNLEFWPGVAEGDMIRVTETGGDGDGDARFERDGFLFVVKRPNDDSGRHSSALQVSPASHK